MTLAQAIAFRLHQATLMGQRLSRRRMVEIDAAGPATLRLGWSNDSALAPVQHGDVPDLDLRDLPRGIEVAEWSAPSDTIDALDPAPTEADIKAAAASLGCRWVDRGEARDGSLTYWLIDDDSRDSRE